jgi:hypothetical protein
LSNGVISAYEFKYSSVKKQKVPPSFHSTYPDASFQVITKDNYLDWIMAHA